MQMAFIHGKKCFISVTELQNSVTEYSSLCRVFYKNEFVSKILCNIQRD